MTLKHLLATAVCALTLAMPLAAQQQAGEPPFPPKPPEEPIPPQPNPQFVWEKPYFEWRHDHYEWVKGKWALPPQPGWVWMPGSWVTKGGKRVWGEAHWKRL